MPISGNLSTPMDPIPIPQFQPVQTKSPQDIGMQPIPSTNQAPYYGGKPGVMADYANNFLQGWMTGKKIKEDKLRNKAADSIGAAKSAVDVVGQSYRTAVESGDQEKVTSTKKALTAAWSNYIGMAEKYVAPADDGKKKSVGKKVKDAIVPHGPELYQQTTLNILKQTDPTTMFGPSKEDQLRQQKEQSQADEASQRKKITDLDLEEHKKVDDAVSTYQKALLSGDTKAQDDAARNLEVLGRKVELPSKQKIEQQISETALGALDKMKQPNMQFGQLSDLEQGALTTIGMGPQIKNPLQAYLSQVGPKGSGKKFANDYEATHQLLMDQTTSRIMGQKPTPLEELRASSRIILRHDLQDPEKAKKFGLSAPLKAGEEPPKWAVEQEAERRYKHSPEDTEDAKMYSDRAVNSILSKSMGTMSPTEQATAKQYFLSVDPETKMQAMNPFPDMSKVPPEQRDQVIAVGKALRQRAVKWTKLLFPDADDATINDRLGPEADYGQGMTAPPKAPEKGLMKRAEDKVGSWFSGPPDAVDPKNPMPGMTAPPSGSSKAGGFSAPPGNYKPEAHYKLSKDGKSAHGGEAVELTAEEAKKLAAAGYALEEVQ